MRGALTAFRRCVGLFSPRQIEIPACEYNALREADDQRRASTLVRKN